MTNPSSTWFDGLRTHASMVKAPVSDTDPVLRTRDVMPLNVIALPNRPAVVQPGEVAVPLVLLGETSSMLVPRPSWKA